MSNEYYGVGPEERAAVSHMLKLPPPYSEQRWEFHLADPARIDEMLDLLEQRQLGLDLRSAFAQLLVASLDAAQTGKTLTAAQAARAAGFFSTDSDVRDRMTFFWLENGYACNARSLASVLGADPSPYTNDEDE